MENKVFIGVGHGGSDPGAVGGGLQEKTVNLAIALSCRAELIRHGVEVKMSREEDENDPLKSRIRECNAFAPALAVDIHNNAGGGDGAEVFHHYKGGLSQTLGNNILGEITRLGQNSRGLKTRLNEQGRDWYGFIRQTVAPAVIVECAFLDNSADRAIVATARQQAEMGMAIAKGILRTLGIAWQPEVYYRVTVSDLGEPEADRLVAALTEKGYKPTKSLSQE